ncbi:hypothetical protein [Cupriavidus sp. U2]|uniref:hypothetical protein n=1 Tax=Cupriavidus sp. U2 TaxID=2920269 RepID=UPI00129DBDE0|nr:hypothetical protein [Cupriavidus sp. U2]
MAVSSPAFWLSLLFDSDFSHAKQSDKRANRVQTLVLQGLPASAALYVARHEAPAAAIGYAGVTTSGRQVAWTRHA